MPLGTARQRKLSFGHFYIAVLAAGGPDSGVLPPTAHRATAWHVRVDIGTLKRMPPTALIVPATIIGYQVYDTTRTTQGIF